MHLGVPEDLLDRFNVFDKVMHDMYPVKNEDLYAAGRRVREDLPGEGAMYYYARTQLSSPRAQKQNCG